MSFQSFTGPFSVSENIGLNDTLGIQFSGRSTDPGDNDLAAGRIYYNNSTNLFKFYNGASWGNLGSGGGGTPSWNSIFALYPTFAISSGTWTIAGSHSDAVAVLTLTNSAGSTGAALQITNSTTSNKDINGTSSNWSVTGAGVGTFAGVSISGTSTAIATTGAAVWTLLDNNSAALGIGAAGNTTMIVLDTTNSAEIVNVGNGTTATGFTVGKGPVIMGSVSNSVAGLLVTNNTMTTFGNAAVSAALAVIRSTSITTGTLLKLQATEGTLTSSGLYFDCWDVTGGNDVFSISRYGATIIRGTASGTASLTLTSGDLIMSDGQLSVTRTGDDAATLTVVNNTAATASSVVISGSGTFTGTTTTSFMTITPSGLTTGTALYLVANAATSSVGVVDIISTSLTSGSLLRLTSSTANFTTGGKMLEITVVAATAGNLISAVTTGAYTGTGMLIMSAGAMTTGVMVSLTSTTGLTSGSLIRATSSTAGAIATNGAVSITGTGNFTSGSALLGFVNVSCNTTAAGTIMNVSGGALTTGVGLSIDDGANVGLTSGSLLRIATASTGAAATNGFVSIRATGAYTSTSNAGLLDVRATGTTAGTIVEIVGNALTTGVALNLSGTGVYTGTGFITVTQSGATTGTVMLMTAVGVTSGGVLSLSANGLTTGTMLSLAHTTAIIADTGSMLRISSTSADTGGATNGTLLDIASTSATSATLIKVVDGALLTGIAFQISHTAGVLASGASLVQLTSASIDVGTTHGTMIDEVANSATAAVLNLITSSSLTTGVGIKMVLNALTSGNGLQITSSSTSATARGLIQLTNSGVGNTTPAIRITQIVQSTHFYKIYTETASGISLWHSDGTTANANLAATTGDICFNAGSNKPEYCTNGGGSLWTALV